MPEMTDNTLVLISVCAVPLLTFIAATVWIFSNLPEDEE